jgi:hypothetical protein
MDAYSLRKMNELKLFESFQSGDDRVIRVPGGWVFYTKGGWGTASGNYAASVFIPRTPKALEELHNTTVNEESFKFIK